MATETFTWAVQRADDGDEQSTVRTAQFGDGYKQTSADGLNSDRQTWAVTCSGPVATVVQIRDFLRRNAGKSFIWTNPLGEAGLYQAPARNFRVLGGGIAVLTSSFEQAFHP